MISFENYEKLKKQKKAKIQETPGFEPGTSRSAVECSTTELYPLAMFSDNLLRYLFF